MSDYFTENLHFLLWSKEPADRERWREILAGWARCDQVRSSALIRGALPSPRELRQLAEVAGHDEEKLRFTRLLDPEEILARNIDHLFAGLDHGQKGEYARALDVDLSTISRWRRGKARPSQAHVRGVATKFSLPAEVDLEESPLFLSPTPVSVSQRREWVKARIDRLPVDQLTALFPALTRLLGGTDGVD